MDSEHRYDERRKEEWLKTVKNYLVGKAHEMEFMLDWAEGFQLHPISPLDVQACSRPLISVQWHRIGRAAVGRMFQICFPILGSSVLSDADLLLRTIVA